RTPYVHARVKLGFQAPQRAAVVVDPQHDRIEPFVQIKKVTVRFSSHRDVAPSVGSFGPDADRSAAVPAGSTSIPNATEWASHYRRRPGGAGGPAQTVCPGAADPPGAAPGETSASDDILLRPLASTE